MNRELLNQILRQIEAHPETWDQTTWIEQDECGTTACVAGWACLLSGWTVESGYNSIYKTVNGSDIYSYVEVTAQRELGLTEEEADWLFAGSRTLEEIKDFAVFSI